MWLFDLHVLIDVEFILLAKLSSFSLVKLSLFLLLFLSDKLRYENVCTLVFSCDKQLKKWIRPYVRSLVRG